MNGSTHLAAGVLTGLVVSNAVNADWPTRGLVVAAAAIGSLLPDWFQVNIPGMNKTVKGVFGHRGLSHWLLTAVVLYMALARLPMAVRYGGVAGYLSHLALDTFNEPGIPALWPAPLRVRLAGWKSGGRGDVLIRVGAWLISTLLMIRLVV